MCVAACTFNPPEAAGPADAPADAPPEAQCADGDSDGDGLCNGADDWPCGVKPAAPAQPMMMDAATSRTWNAFNIDIGDNRRVVRAAGQEFPADFRWGGTVVCGSGRCPIQMEIGYSEKRTGCLLMGAVDASPNPIQIGAYRLDRNLRAPALPGVYELRLNMGYGGSAACASGQSWFDADPGPESTIAFVCVPP